jgi:hypothetical protein
MIGRAAGDKSGSSDEKNGAREKRHSQCVLF